MLAPWQITGDILEAVSTLKINFTELRHEAHFSISPRIQIPHSIHRNQLFYCYSISPLPRPLPVLIVRNWHIPMCYVVFLFSSKRYLAVSGRTRRSQSARHASKSKEKKNRSSRVSSCWRFPAVKTVVCIHRNHSICCALVERRRRRRRPIDVNAVNET